MLVQESLIEETLHYKNMYEYDIIDELEETLSFCDLPLHSDLSEWEEDLSIEESQGSSSISSSEQDYFEFISQDPSTHSQPENIFFCGKLIPYKQPNPLEKNSSQVVLKSNTQTNMKKKHPWGLFKWKFISTKRVHSKKSTTLVQKRDQSESKMYNGNKHEKGYDFSLHKMPILQSTSSGKARWHFLLFGISKFSSHMEIKDIKTRQSLMQYSPPVLRSPNHDDKFSGRRNGSSGVLGLIKVLSCGGNHHPNTMVVASIR